MFVFGLYLVFRTYDLKLGGMSFVAMLACVIAIAMVPVCEAEIVRATAQNIPVIAFVHKVLVNLIIFLGIVSVWLTRRRLKRRKMKKAEVVVAWLYAALTVGLFVLMAYGFDDVYSFRKINGLWAYHIANGSPYKIYLGIWLFMSLATITLLIISAYKKTLIREKRVWMHRLLLTFIVLPGIMYLMFFLLNRYGYAYFLYSPFLVVCSYAWVHVYSNFKVFDPNPANAMSNILDNIPNIVLMTDKNFKIRYLNNLGQGTPVHKKSNIKGKPFGVLLRLIGTELTDGTLDTIAALNKGKTFQFEITTIGKRYFRIYANPVFTGNDKKLGYVFIGHDITITKNHEAELQRMNQELQASNKELEQFAYMASHDLKTPLRNVISFSGLLQRSIKAGKLDDADEYLGYIIKYGKNMSDIIADVLELCRIGKNTSGVEPVDINALLREVMIELGDRIEKAKAAVNYHTMPNVLGSKSQLKQVFLNLVENAIKYNSSEAPKVGISYCYLSENEHKFTVSDNGIGFEQKYADDVFQIFKRLHTMDEYEGTGIGLAMCKKIVQAHGGGIWIYSERGKGTKVSFTLPTVISKGKTPPCPDQLN